MTSYSRFTAPVRGGEIAGGIWQPEGPATGTILAVHGITSSHLAWSLVASMMPSARIIAVDLRGRGASRDLPGPWGMAQHSDDLAAVLDHFGVERALVVGHSMGGFASVTLASRHPERVAGLVLVDGGLPIPRPEGITDPNELTAALLGPAAERLAMTFASRETYREFWKAHPTFATTWNPAIEAYIDYDLVGQAPRLHPSSRYEAVAADSLELAGDTRYVAALKGLAGPVHFIRAPRGLLDQVPALYPPEQIDHWAEALPHMVVHEAVDVNHYSIVLTELGSEMVARVVDEAQSDQVVQPGKRGISR